MVRIVEETVVARPAKAVLNGLVAFNQQKVGKAKFKRFSITVRDDEDKICGGIVAYSLWNWCFIELLWLDESLRGKGHGTALIQRVEAIARKRGLQHIYLDTFSFQGDGFYQKLGYEVFGRLDNFPPGQHRIWLKKDLT